MNIDIFGFSFNIIEDFPESPENNTCYVWKKNGYYKARCYSDYHKGEGFGNEIDNEHDDRYMKNEAIRNAIYFVIQEIMEDELCELLPIKGEE